MTRKKFTKKLMAEGFSRNEANRIAIKGNKSGIPYQKYYEFEYQWLRLSVAIGRVGSSLKDVRKSANQLASAMAMSFEEAICYEVKSYGSNGK